MEYGALILAGYLLGSFPTGYLVGKALKNKDVRTYGSGRIGAANVLRIMGFGPFVFVFCVDFAKGFAPAWAAGQLFAIPFAQESIALATLVGHSWSIFIGFSGGRGVATGLGGLYAIMPQAAALSSIITCVLMLATRYISLGAIVGVVMVTPITLVYIALGLEQPLMLLYVIPGGALIVGRHWDNIQRLASGTERKLGEQVETD